MTASHPVPPHRPYRRDRPPAPAARHAVRRLLARRAGPGPSRVLLGRSGRRARRPGAAVPRPRARHFLVLLAAGGTVLGFEPKHRRDAVHAACAASAALLPRSRRAARRRVDRRALPAGRRPLCGRLTHGRTLPAFVLAGIAWPLAGLRGLPWLGRTLGGSPARQRAARAAHRWSGRAGPLVFGLLFASPTRSSPSGRRARARPHLDTFVLRASSPVPSAAPCSPRRTSPQPARGRPPPGGPAPRPVAHRFEWLARCCWSTPSSRCSSSPRRPSIFGGHDYLRAHDRPDLRRVRPPGLRPAHRRHRADAAGRLGGGPQGAAETPGPGLDARLAGPAVRADAGRGGLGAATGCTSTRRPTASPGSACWSTSSRAGSGCSCSRVLAAGVTGALRPPGCPASRCSAGGRPARPRRGQPGRLDRAAQPRPVRRDRQGRLDLPPGLSDDAGRRGCTTRRTPRRSSAPRPRSARRRSCRPWPRRRHPR
jgi:hypothetical protein